MKHLFTICFLMASCFAIAQPIGGDFRKHSKGPLPVYFTNDDTGTASNYKILKGFTTTNFHSVGFQVNVNKLSGSGSLDGCVYQMWGSKIVKPGLVRYGSAFPDEAGYILLATDTVRDLASQSFSHDVNDGEGNTYRHYLFTMHMVASGAPFLSWNVTANLP